MTGCKAAMVLVCAAAILFLPGCPESTPTANVIALGRNMPLDYGAHGNRVRRTYAIYGGTAAQDVGIFTMRSGISTSNPLVIRDGNGTEITRLTTENSLASEGAVRVPGNIALVEANYDGNGTPPSVNISRVDITTTRSVNFPPSEGAFTMQLNTPLELFFNDTTRSTYFVTVRGVAGKRIDVVLDGPGRVHVSDTDRVVLAADTGQPLPGSRVLEVADSTTGGIASFAPGDNIRDVLHLTVSNVTTGGAGHARLSVNEIRDVIPLRIWLNTKGPRPFNGDRADTVRGVVPSAINEAARALYQATGGRVRFGTVEVLLGDKTPSAPPKVDVRVDGQPAGPLRSHVFGFQDMPPASIHLTLLDWYNARPARRGQILAHELMHYRYVLPDEYREPLPFEAVFTPPAGCPWCLCPGSMMSGPGDELCWPGNHNPFGDSVLRARTSTLQVVNGSMWNFMASRLGVPVPSSSPARVLRGSVGDGTSSIDFRTTISFL